jgi:dTDP-glucose 4,6-dehydratase
MAGSDRRLLVTGGAGFLGSHFIRHRLATAGDAVLNVDLLTYAGSLERVADLHDDPRYSFLQTDVADASMIHQIFVDFRPELVVHFAAESHVTRSETRDELFRRTNVEGTRVMLAAAADAGVRRFVHISTDEVYGPITEGAFREEEKEPGDGRATSPYARSKALADDAAQEFSGGDMEVVVLRPTNCFGPWQHPEKAFARWVIRALWDLPVLVWGDGLYVRQWLFAQDLAHAVKLVADAPEVGRVYNVGPRHDPEITNLALARWLVGRLGLPEDRVVLTEYDRPDHDRRYAIDPSRIESLGWRAGEVWDEFTATVDWYRENESWWRPLLEEAETIYTDQPSA